jgi:hypothetical protein
MGEAVGTLYEAAAGLEPLTRFDLPRANSVAAATKRPAAKEAAIAWQIALPDRALAMRAGEDGQLRVLSWDGTLSRIDAAGKIISQQPVAAAEMPKISQELQTSPDARAVQLGKQRAPAGRIVKHVAAQKDLMAVGYWGGTLEVHGSDGSTISRQLLTQDITGLAWLGGRLVVGLADGRVVALKAD